MDETNAAATCIDCGEAIEREDTLIPMPVVENNGKTKHGYVHRECMFRIVVGGIGHHLNHDLHCVQNHDPDGGRTSRKSALQVWELREKILADLKKEGPADDM